MNPVGPMTMLIVGIDPGIHGAVAFIRLDPGELPQLLSVHDLPLAETKPLMLMLPNCTTLLCSYPDIPGIHRHVFIESVHAAPRQGVSSMFRFGYATGAMHGIIAALGLRVSLLAPLVWQRQVQAQAGPEAARLRAQQVFPDRAELFSLKKDGNKAAAALIALAGARLSDRHLIR